MAAEQVTEPPLELRMSRSDWHALQRHLFPGDQDEHGAALLCGTATSARSRRLLVRDVVYAEDGVDYVPGTRGYRHLTGEFVTRNIRRAKDEGLVYLAVHNHGGTDHVRFSRDDLRSHERGYPTLLGLTGLPVGAVVLAQRAVAGDVWLPDGTRLPLERMAIAGGCPAWLTPSPTERESSADPRYDRQSLLYGSRGQQILARAKVGVVGAGGVGMLLIQALARLGVGAIVVIDPERVDPTNLPRLPGATNLDAMTWLDRDGRPQVVRAVGRNLARRKSRVAKRIVRQANRSCLIQAVAGDAAKDNTARLLTDCDYIFLAADTMLARDVVNQIAYQYLIPTAQVGSKVVIDPETGEVRDIFSVVRSLGTRPGCLRCNGLIDLRRLAEESLGDARQVMNQRYIDEPEVHAPSVITLNMVGAAWAANEFMQYMVGLRELASDYQLLRTGSWESGPAPLILQDPSSDERCHVCGRNSMSALARGDQRELPTRTG